MARPSPMPPNRRAMPASPWMKGWKIHEMPPLDADPGVGDEELEIAVRSAAEPRLDPSFRHSEFHRIAQEVHQHLPESRQIGGQLDAADLHQRVDRDGLSQCLGPAHFDAGLQELGGIERLLEKLDLGPFRPRKLDDVADQRREVAARVANVAGIVAIGRVAERSLAFLGENFLKADDRIERRYQLMAHHRQEMRLVGACPLRLLLGADEVPGRPAMRRDVAPETAIADEASGAVEHRFCIDLPIAKAPLEPRRELDLLDRPMLLHACQELPQAARSRDGAARLVQALATD